MAAKGYTSAAAVAAYLGVTLTAAQITQCEALLEPAEQKIDAHCGRTFMVGTITAEQHKAHGPKFFLLNTPITAITAVVGVRDADGEETTLTADTDYRLLDAAAGELQIDEWASYDRFKVTYTCDAGLPAIVGLAAAVTVAAWLIPALTQMPNGVQSYKLPDLEVTYARRNGAAGLGLPPEAEGLLDDVKWARFA